MSSLTINPALLTLVSEWADHAPDADPVRLTVEHVNPVTGQWYTHRVISRDVRAFLVARQYDDAASTDEHPVTRARYFDCEQIGEFWDVTPGGQLIPSAPGMNATARTPEPGDMWIYPYAEISDVYRVESVDGDTVHLRRPRKRVDATRTVSVEDLIFNGRRCVQ